MKNTKTLKSSAMKTNPMKTVRRKARKGAKATKPMITEFSWRTAVNFVLFATRPRDGRRMNINVANPAEMVDVAEKHKVADAPWIVVAVTTGGSSKTIEDAFDEHAHQVVGQYETLPQALEAGESFARAWAEDKHKTLMPEDRAQKEKAARGRERERSTMRRSRRTRLKKKTAAAEKKRKGLCPCPSEVLDGRAATQEAAGDGRHRILPAPDPQVVRSASLLVRRPPRLPHRGPGATPHEHVVLPAPEDPSRGGRGEEARGALGRPGAPEAEPPGRALLDGPQQVLLDRGERPLRRRPGPQPLPPTVVVLMARTIYAVNVTTWAGMDPRASHFYARVHWYSPTDGWGSEDVLGPPDEEGFRSSRLSSREEIPARSREWFAARKNPHRDDALVLGVWALALDLSRPYEVLEGRLFKKDGSLLCPFDENAVVI